MTIKQLAVTLMYNMMFEVFLFELFLVYLYNFLFPKYINVHIICTFRSKHVTCIDQFFY